MHDRIVQYLRHKNDWVTKDDLILIARKAGYSKDALLKALEGVLNEPEIGYTWSKEHGTRIRFYHIDPRIKKAMLVVRKWFDSLK